MKYETDLILEVLSQMIDGKSMNAVAREKGIPVSTVYSWKQQYADYYDKLVYQKNKFRRLKSIYHSIGNEQPKMKTKKAIA